MGQIEAPREMNFKEKLQFYAAMANPLFWAVVLKFPSNTDVSFVDCDDRIARTEVVQTEDGVEARIPTGNTTVVKSGQFEVKVKDWRPKRGRGGDAYIDNETTGESLHLLNNDYRERTLCEEPRITVKHGG